MEEKTEGIHNPQTRKLWSETGSRGFTENSVMYPFSPDTHAMALRESSGQGRNRTPNETPLKPKCPSVIYSLVPMLNCTYSLCENLTSPYRHHLIAHIHPGPKPVFAPSRGTAPSASWGHPEPLRDSPWAFSPVPPSIAFLDLQSVWFLQIQ